MEVCHISSFADLTDGGFVKYICCTKCSLKGTAGLTQADCCLLQGFVSNADFNSKKTMLVLFINGRPVDCSPLKRALEATYAAILPKAAKPWIFLVRCML